MNRRVRIVMDESDMLAVVLIALVEWCKTGWLAQMRRHSNLFDASLWWGHVLPSVCSWRQLAVPPLPR